MGLYPVAVCYNARWDKTIQYNTITHITQNNIQHSNLQMWPRAVYECATQGVPNIRVLQYE